MAILGPAIGKLGLAFIKMGAESGPAVTGLAKGLSAILDGVGQLFTTLGKFSKAGGSILDTLGKAVGALGGPLGTVIGVLNSALAPLLQGLLPAFRQLLQQIAGVVKAAGPGLLGIGQALGADAHRPDAADAPARASLRVVGADAGLRVRQARDAAAADPAAGHPRASSSLASTQGH